MSLVHAGEQPPPCSSATEVPIHRRSPNTALHRRESLVGVRPCMQKEDVERFAGEEFQGFEAKPVAEASTGL